MSNEQQREALMAQHAKCLKALEAAAADLTGTLVRVQQHIREVEEKGGIIDIQRQMNFFTSSYARMMKDWGVAEHLQRIGAKQKPQRHLR